MLITRPRIDRGPPVYMTALDLSVAGTHLVPQVLACLLRPQGKLYPSFILTLPMDGNLRPGPNQLRESEITNT
jgi:hypothetical protein